MNIAELFVRVRGDTTDVTSKLRGVEGSLGGLERATGRAHLSTGKLRQEFQTLARQLTGVHPIVTQLSGVLGEFALGGGVTLGILGGIGAIALAYEKMAGGAKKAREETDKLIKSLVDQARAAYLATVQGQELIQLQAEMELQAAKRASGVGIRSAIGALLGRPGLDPADAEAASNRIANAQTAVEQATKNVGKAWEDTNKPVSSHVQKVTEVTGKYNELRDAAAKVNAQMMDEKRDWWKNYIESTGRAITITQQLEEAAREARPELLDIVKGMLPSTPGPANISDSVRIAGDQAEEINNAAAKHTEDLKDAIWGAGLQSAQIIVSALNIGGGGKGSGLGGALGSTAGFAAGFAIGGPIGGAIGSTLGTITGSLIGGLFDHKKAVDNNTAALNRVANLLNAPSGFKGAYYTYQAEDARRIYRSMEETARRQGTRGGNTGFTLRAGA